MNVEVSLEAYTGGAELRVVTQRSETESPRSWLVVFFQGLGGELTVSLEELNDDGTPLHYVGSVQG